MVTKSYKLEKDRTYLFVSYTVDSIEYLVLLKNSKIVQHDCFNIYLQIHKLLF